MELVLRGQRAFRLYRLRTQRYAVLVAHRRCGKRSGSSLENIAACTP